jgi:hypothetical protein
MLFVEIAALPLSAEVSDEFPRLRKIDKPTTSAIATKTSAMTKTDLDQPGAWMGRTPLFAFHLWPRFNF